MERERERVMGAGRAGEGGGEREGAVGGGLRAREHALHVMQAVHMASCYTVINA